MTLTADLIEDTRGHLGAPDTLNQIAAVDAVSTSVRLSRALRNVGVGTLLSVGLETMHVWAVTDATTGTLEVRRGHGGSTAVAHLEGEVVRVAPEHTDFAILRALNNDLAALSGAGLFAVRTLDLTASGSARTYDLAADVLGVIDVRVDYEGLSNEWPLVKSWLPLSDMPLSDFPSGKALRLDEAVPDNRPLRVRYKARFADLATLTDDVEAVSGLRASAHDLPPLGAAWRLTAPQEIERNQMRRQGDSRRSEEVPPGAVMRSPLGLQQIRQDRIAEELNNQARQYPHRSTR